MNPHFFDMHGVVIYPVSHPKHGDEAFVTNHDIRNKHLAFVTPNDPLQFALPTNLGGTIFGSSYPEPFSLPYEVAAHRLFGDAHKDFSNYADAATRFYSGHSPNQEHNDFTHYHGIGSWENVVEPSMVTAFHKPISLNQLVKIAADVGSYARQLSMLAFRPHPNGLERLLHMRVPSHSPLIKRLSPSIVADAARPIHEAFNQHYTVSPQGLKEYLMPGRSILPDDEGHTDVLVWIPPWHKHPQAAEDSFHHIAYELGATQPVRYWTGNGIMLGGTEPFSDDELKHATDAEKRYIAKENYHRVLHSTNNPNVTVFPQKARNIEPEIPEPMHYAMRAPAKTGAVIRGVFYPPGKIIPTLVTSGQTPSKMSLGDFREKLSTFLKKKKGDTNAHDGATRTGGNGGPSHGATGSRSDNSPAGPATATTGR